jgi:hypothetical protein
MSVKKKSKNKCRRKKKVQILFYSIRRNRYIDDDNQPEREVIN